MESMLKTIICLLIITNICLLFEVFELRNNLTSFLEYNTSSCKDILLNISNPFSYINKVTKPFLIELVNNATKVRQKL
jgi:hypothetical protein